MFLSQQIYKNLLLISGKRFLTYIRLILHSNQPVPIPPGFTDFGDELSNFATAFKRVSFYNYAVYREYYHEILTKLENQPQPTVPNADTNQLTTDGATATSTDGATATGESK